MEDGEDGRGCGIRDRKEDIEYWIERTSGMGSAAASCGDQDWKCV